jgi:S1/P1 Nuclease
MPAPALAWGDIGHRIICEIAFQELQPTARERVKAIIRRDPEFDTFAESCTWPDQPRRHDGPPGRSETRAGARHRAIICSAPPTAVALTLACTSRLGLVAASALKFQELARLFKADVSTIED